MPRSVLTGSRIRERRSVLGIKQAELAKKTGISASYLNLIEHNRRRIGGKLVVDIARHLGVDPKMLTEGAEAVLLETLREAAAGHGGVSVERDRVEEFAGRFPGWAALIIAQFRHHAGMERTIEILSDRLTHDPFLSASLHEVISTVTAIRSTSSILTESTDIDPEWLARFHRNINEESRRLTESSQSLIAYLDGVGDADTGRTSPQEELDAFLLARGYHLPELEAGGADVAEHLASSAGSFVTQSGRAVATQYFKRYAQDAQSLPQMRLLEAIERCSLDPFALASHLAAPLPIICRRLATLPADQVTAQIGIVTCDGSGALMFRKEIAGFAIPRFGAACSLWPLYQTLSRPQTPLRTLLEHSNRMRDRFTGYTISELHHPTGFDGPQVVEATMLIVPDSEENQQNTRPVPIGVNCRICPRGDCAARREPSILAEEF